MLRNTVGMRWSEKPVNLLIVCKWFSEGATKEAGFEELRDKRESFGNIIRMIHVQSKTSTLNLKIICSS